MVFAMFGIFFLRKLPHFEGSVRLVRLQRRASSTSSTVTRTFCVRYFFGFFFGSGFVLHFAFARRSGKERKLKEKNDQNTVIRWTVLVLFLGIVLLLRREIVN